MTDGRANRYAHDPRELDDGRRLVTRRMAAFLAQRHVDHIRTITDAQRRRWAGGHRDPGEDPIEVLCTLHPRTRRRGTVLLDVDALTEHIATRPFADWKRRRKPLDVD